MPSMCMKVWELYTNRKGFEGLSKEDLIFKFDVFALLSLEPDLSPGCTNKGVIYSRAGRELMPFLHHYCRSSWIWCLFLLTALNSLQSVCLQDA